MRAPAFIRGSRSLSTALMVSGLMLAASASAAPTGGQVVGGLASITSGPATTTINQNSAATIINWQQFNIAPQEQVVFHQPSATSTALNRVVGGSAAEIFGSLSANGRVFLLDPQGVVFGRGAVIDVGSLFASTLAIKDADFMAGRYVFSAADYAGGAVSNAGSLTARAGGFVVLAGQDVSNSGLVQARLGHVVLAAGKALTLDFNGDGMLSYVVTPAAAAARVDNSGTLLADGGAVALTAQSAGAAIGAVVNNRGLVQARSIAHRGGSIVLSGDGGDVNNAGTLDASGSNKLAGGGITLAASRDIDLASGSVIDVSGGGGGTVRAMASGLLASDAGSRISAASLSALPAGFVELSGRRALRVRGALDIGRGGRLLLDPVDLSIADGSGTDTTTTIFAQNVQTQLRAGTDVTLNADHSITFANLSQALDGRNAGNGGALAVTLNDGSGVGGRIFFSDVTDNVLADGQILFNSGNGSMTVGNLTGGNVLLQSIGAVSAGNLTATRGGLQVFADHADLSTGTLSATRITTDRSAAGADIAVFAGSSITVNGSVTTVAEVHDGAAVCSSNCASAIGKIDLHSNSDFAHGTHGLTVTGAISARAVSGGAFVAEVRDGQGNLVTPSQGDANAAVSVFHHDPFAGAPSVGNIDVHGIQATAIATAGDSAINGGVVISDDGGGRVDTHGGSVVAGGFDAGGNALTDAGSIRITSGIGQMTIGGITATRSGITVQNGNRGGGNTPADTSVVLGPLSAGSSPQNTPYALTTLNLVSGGSMSINSPGGSITTSSIDVEAAAGDFVFGALTATRGGIRLENGGNISTGALTATHITTDGSAANADVVIFAGGSINVGGAINTDAQVRNGAAPCVAGCGGASGKVDLHSNSAFAPGATTLATRDITTRAVTGDRAAAAGVTLTHHFSPDGATTGTIDTGAITTLAISDAPANAKVNLANETIGHISTGAAAIVATGSDNAGNAQLNAGDITLQTGQDNISTGALTATNSSITVTDGNFGGANHASDTQVTLGPLSGGFDAQNQPYALHQVNVLSGGSVSLSTQGGLTADDISIGAGDGDFTAGALHSTGGKVVVEARNGNITLNAAPTGAGCSDPNGCVFIDTDQVLTIDTGNAPLVLDQVNLGLNSIFTSNIVLRSSAGTTVTNSRINGGVIDIQGPQAINVIGSTLTSDCQVASDCLHIAAGTDLLLQNTAVTDIAQISLVAGRHLTFDNTVIGFSQNFARANFYHLSARAGAAGPGDLLLSNNTQLSSASVLLEADGDITDGGQAGSRIDSDGLGVGTSGNIDLAATQLIASAGAAPIGGDPGLFGLILQQVDTADKPALFPVGDQPVASFIGRSVKLGALSVQGDFEQPGTPAPGHYIYFQTDNLTLGQMVDAPTALVVQFVPFTQGASIGVEQVQSNNRTVNFGVDTQLSKFPGTTYAFGGSGYTGDIYNAENAPIDVTSQGSGAESFAYLTSGSVSGQDSISTKGSVVVLQAPDDFAIPLFNQFQPGADEDDEQNNSGGGKKPGEGGAAKAVRVRLPRGSVARRTRIDAKECR